MLKKIDACEYLREKGLLSSTAEDSFPNLIHLKYSKLDKIIEPRD